jgi:predicted ATPase with chaperone activity
MQVFMVPVDPTREREHARVRSVDIKERVERARAILGASPISLQTGALEGDTAVLLNRAVGRLGLSMRVMERIKKVSKTIAALDGETLASPLHLSEALRYRRVWK